MIHSLTTGKGFPTVLRFSLPLILGAFIHQIYSVTDSLIVGNVLGSQALGAVGTTGSCLFFMFSLNSGLSNGCSVVIAQSLGSDSEERVKVSLVSTIYYTLVCTVAISAVGCIGAKPLLRLLQTPEDILPMAAVYLRICAGAAFGQILYTNMSAVLHAFGDSRTPLVFLILCTLLNVALDFLFVAAFSMGVAGAAVATVLAQLISGVLCLAYAIGKYPVFRVRRQDMKPSFENIREIAGIGIPMAVQSSVLSVGDMIVTGIINSYGTAMVAAYAAASRIHQFCVIPFLQFAMAFCTFAAQNIGAGLAKRIRQTMRTASVFVIVTSLTLGLVMRIFRLALLGFFVSPEDALAAEVMQIGGDFLAIVPMFYPFLALIWLYNYMLRGVGESHIPMVSCAIELGAKIAMPLLLGKEYGHVGVWLGYPMCWILGWIPSLICYLQGGWQERYKKGHAEVPESAG